MVGDELAERNSLQTNTHSIKEEKSEIIISNKFQDAFLADSIAIYRGLVAGGPYQKIASVPATQNSFADSNVFALRDYFYVVNIF